MSQFDEPLRGARSCDVKERTQITEMMLNMISHGVNPSAQDRQALSDYAFEQVDFLTDEIPGTTPYKKLDGLCQLADTILGLLAAVYPSKDAIPPDQLGRIQRLISISQDAQPLETTVNLVFDQEKIEGIGVDRMLSFARNASDEYQKGKLYYGLLHFKDRFSRMDVPSKEKITAYLESELERYGRISAPDGDTLDAMEAAVDVAAYFPGERTPALLTEILKGGHANVNYYALATLIALGQEIPAQTVAGLAADPVYAHLTYNLLKDHGMVALFPEEYASPENLAKSDLIHWLIYPTELGQIPDEIEYLGQVSVHFKKKIYYVFRFRSGSENLDDATRGKWLIGWSNEEGGTFSNFDLYSEYEMGTAEKTLKNIKKRLIG